MAKKKIAPEVGFTVTSSKFEGEGTVVSKAAGWLTVKYGDDESGNFRAADLECYAQEVKMSDAGAVPAASDEEDDGSVRIRADLNRYEATKAASGNRSYDTGDEVAEMFRGKDLEEVYKLAARDLKANGENVTIKALKERYANLNPGHQRMCVGNKVRAARARAANEGE